MDKETNQGCAAGCGVALGLGALALIAWLIWRAILWIAGGWNWAWGLGTAVALPLVGYLVVVAWREPQPFRPARQREEWFTAVAVATLIVLAVVVLIAGWGTAVFATALGLAVSVAAGVVPNDWSPPELWAPQAASALGLESTLTDAVVSEASAAPAADEVTIAEGAA